MYLNTRREEQNNDAEKRTTGKEYEKKQNRTLKTTGFHI